MPETLEKSTSDLARSHFVAHDEKNCRFWDDLSEWLNVCPVDISEAQRGEILAIVATVLRG